MQIKLHSYLGEFESVAKRLKSCRWQRHARSLTVSATVLQPSLLRTPTLVAWTPSISILACLRVVCVLLAAVYCTHAQTIFAPGLPGPIPDPGQVIFSLNYPTAGTIVGMELFFQFTHQCERDLTIDMVAPDGTTVRVMDHGLMRCSGVSTTFTSLNTQVGDPAFFGGHQAAGTWKFIVTDGTVGNSGTLDAWRLTITAKSGGDTCQGSNIDSSLSNSQIDVVFTGGCDGLLTIKNKKNYWTNFVISTTGSATIVPLGGNTNLYAQAGLLPPSGLVGSGTGVIYNLHLSRSGESVSIFVDPTGQTGNGYAKFMNLVQIVLNAVGGSAAATLAITEYQQVAQTFAQMPHFNAAATALFSNPPSIATFFKELGLVVTDLDEVAAFISLIQSVDVGLGSSVIKTVLGAPWRILNTIISAVGNVIDFAFRYPTGSVRVIAQ